MLAGCSADPPKDFDGCTTYDLGFSTTAYGDQFYFDLSDNWSQGWGANLKPIALGGRESVLVDGVWPATLTATAETPELSIARIDPSSRRVVVSGDAAGVGQLCASDPERAHVDGRDMQVRPVDAALVLPARYEWTNERYPFDSWRMFVGEQRVLTLALIDDQHARLVDNEMTISVASGVASVRPRPDYSWDSLILDVPTPTVVGVTVTLASGESHDASIEIVDSIDRFAIEPGAWYRLQHFQVGQLAAPICFAGYLGPALVMGAPWRFEASNIVALAEDGRPNCVNVTPIEAGAGTITAFAGGSRYDLPIAVQPN